LRDDSVGGGSSFVYQRYDLSLTRESVDGLKPGIDKETLESLTEMDEPGNMQLLKELAEIDSMSRIDTKHFPRRFDLK
jgi:hypothetical protein